MIQIIRDSGTGEKLGTGLSAALSALAQSKFNQVQQQHDLQRQQAARQSGLQALFGPEQAKELAFLEPELLKPLITQKVKGEQGISQASPGLRTLMPELNEQEANKVSNLTPGLQLEFYRNYLQNPAAVKKLVDSIKPHELIQPSQPREIQVPKESGRSKQEEKLDNVLTKMLDKGQFAGVEAAPQQNISPTQPIKPEKIKAEEALTPKQQKEFLKDRAEEIITKDKQEGRIETPKTIAEAVREGRISKEEASEKKKEQKEANKDTKKLYDTINSEYRAAKDDLIRLDKILDLNEKGNLGFPIFNSLISLIGKGTFGFADLGFLMTRDAQALEKISNDFIKNAKQYFGARMTDQDLRAYLKTIPTLMNSKEGRREVIRNMRLFLEKKQLRKRAMDQIIKANGGERPGDLDSMIEEILEPLTNNLADQFKASPHFPQEQPNIVKRILQGVGLEY